jgi:lambda family phage minor tail protein L
VLLLLTSSGAPPPGPTIGLLEVAQLPAVDALVTLFQLDATALGSTVYRWVSGTFADAPVVYQGNTYTPLPIEAEGFEWNGRGTLPTPVLRVSNIGGFAGALVIGFGDLLGAEITRLRTFARFLDGQPDADPDAHFPADVFRVERKRIQDPEMIEWELATVLDQEGVELPGRQALKSACTHTYRRWDGAAFDYTRATCPYGGTVYYRADGTSTTNPALDRCGKKLGDCAARFGNDPLPTRAFPGMLRV